MCGDIFTNEKQKRRKRCLGKHEKLSFVLVQIEMSVEHLNGSVWWLIEF